jgi:uncharacterized repeat protein (TIGR01451 family)
MTQKTVSNVFVTGTVNVMVSAFLVLGPLRASLSPAVAASSSNFLPLTVAEVGYHDANYLFAPVIEKEAGVSHNLTSQNASFIVNFNPAAGCATSGLPNFMPSGTLAPWPSQAQDAFNRALNIWAMLLNVNQTIVINACWLSPDVPAQLDLGISQPVSAYANFAGAPVADTMYPVALANQLAGADLNNSDGPDHDGNSTDADAEIIIAFNSTKSWYYGLDASPSSNKYDLVTVALHEIGHGLGFISSFFVNTSTVKPCALVGSTTTGDGCWGLGFGQPAIYDRFVENSSNQQLINTTVFTNPSAALGSQLTTTNNVFFNGPNAKAAEGNGNRPRLYSPNPFEISSSILHLDKNTYNGTFNQLMTPIINSGTSQHHPGPITLGIFKDMGWSVVDLPPVTLTQTASANSVQEGQVLTYTLTGTNTGFLIMTNVLITDIIPAHTTLNAASLSGDAANSGTTPGSVITWTTGLSLTTGVALSRTFAVTLAADLTGVSTITNTAFVTSSAGVGANATLSITVAGRTVFLPLVWKEN